ncbi:MAG: efflux RND transporter periplasmic adaptor subunit [Acidaminococcaceae bacterium]|nr:efflux RND transporter periplasmic adaptor subunit [Acidaminococcaceae bacterium]
MNWHDKRVKILLVFVVVITAIISWRIVSNIMGARAKAQQAGKGRTVAVATGFATYHNIKPQLKLSGHLDPIWQADVAAKISARLERVYVDVGDQVGQGQILAVLDAGELAATANSAQGSVFDARANLDNAETVLVRCKKLYTSGAISKADLDNAQFSRDMAAGKLVAAEGTYANALSRVQGTEVVAPQQGTIVKRYFHEGYYAPVGTALFNIADTTALQVKLNVPEGQISLVSLGAQADIVIPAMDNKKVLGTITKLAQVADLPARTFAAEVTVLNSNKELRGGLFANVVVEGKERQHVLTIPETAIVMREDQRTVYVVDKNNKISRKVLVTGYIGNGIVEILDGLTAEDEIVLSGQNRIREGSVVTKNDSGAQK